MSSTQWGRSPAQSTNRIRKQVNNKRQRERIMWDNVLIDSATDRPKRATGLYLPRRAWDWVTSFHTIDAWHLSLAVTPGFIGKTLLFLGRKEKNKIGGRSKRSISSRRPIFYSLWTTNLKPDKPEHTKDIVVRLMSFEMNNNEPFKTQRSLLGLFFPARPLLNCSLLICISEDKSLNL